MYKSCNFKRFLKLLCVDALVFLCLFITANMAGCFSAGADSKDEEFINVPIIAYHSIVKDKSEKYIITPDTFENDLKYLSENGYQTIFAEQLADYVYNNTPLPPKPIIITFDDGLYNNLYYALPLLEKYDMCAIISVVGSYICNVSSYDPQQPDFTYLIWEDLLDLLNSKRIEIGNHTYSMHNNAVRKGSMRKIGESEESYSAALTRDIGLLQSMIYAETGYIPITFSYPFGHVSEESLPVLREFGFKVTLTFDEGINKITSDPDCLYGLKRFNRDGSLSTEEFMLKIK